MSTSPSAASILVGLDLRPQDAYAARDSLRQVVAGLGRLSDSRVVFPEVYLHVTERIVAGLEAGRFCEPMWLSNLVGYFAELYLEALADSVRGVHPTTGAWAVAMAPRAGLVPTQRALLGINAHINADLARVVARCVHTGDMRRIAAYKRDYDLVNQVLVEAMPEVLGTLAQRHGCPVARVARRAAWAQRRLVNAVMPAIQHYREQAWKDGLMLLSSSSPGVMAQRLDQRAVSQAKFVVVPLPGAVPRLPAARRGPSPRPVSAPRLAA